MVASRTDRSIRSWIKSNYGSVRGFIKTLYYRLISMFGAFRKERNIAHDKVRRLVFVCQGNICRSPFAEVVARKRGIEAISCGIDAITGTAANATAIKTADRLGYDLGAHRSLALAELELLEGDLLIAMEPAQLGPIKQQFDDTPYVTLLGLWQVSSLPYITDPYGKSEEYFEVCFQRIISSVNGLTKEDK